MSRKITIIIEDDKPFNGKEVDLKPFLPRELDDIEKNSWNDAFKNYKKKEQKCLIEEFYKKNPKKDVCMISCPCPKCRIWC